MLPVETLAALDLTQWLGSEVKASERLCCHQSTVSRRVQAALQLFEAQLVRVDGELQLVVPDRLLAMQREVHQLARLLMDGPLRLELDHWVGRDLLEGRPSQWQLGRSGGIGIRRPLQLLRQRVVDAWLASKLSDLPDPADPDFEVVELARVPLVLLAGSEHPLQSERRITPEQLRAFPSLGIAGDPYPGFAGDLRNQGLWSHAVEMRRYAFGRWEALALDGTTTVPSNALALVQDPALKPLPWHSELQDCVAVVVRSDVAGTPAIERLLVCLRQQLNALRSDHPQLTLMA